MATAAERAEGLFRMLDNDHDGSVDKADFDLLTLSLGAVIGVAPGKDGWQLLTKGTDNLWRTLVEITGTDKSGKVAKGRVQSN
ncbi:EF-hand domain-containing protein [Kitasatospora sp. NPDC098663]|uniref:EF-hand domain-containing protein n=1 Tax=Kitasatospora sp. NPDC098663 TaxID=3364096 RepID=UPI00380EFCAA